MTSSFFRQITSFSDSFHYTKTCKKNLYVGSLNFLSYTIQIGSNINWYMDASVRDLEGTFFKATFS